MAENATKLALTTCGLTYALVWILGVFGRKGCFSQCISTELKSLQNGVVLFFFSPFGFQLRCTWKKPDLFFEHELQTSNGNGCHAAMFRYLLNASLPQSVLWHAAKAKQAKAGSSLKRSLLWQTEATLELPAEYYSLVPGHFTTQVKLCAQDTSFFLFSSNLSWFHK